MFAISTFVANSDILTVSRTVHRLPKFAKAPFVKIKQNPEDFQVEELTDVNPTADGPFAYYRLHKVGWTTPDAIRIMQRRWHMDSRRFSYGGLKDRHASTVQYITIFHGPRRRLSQEGIDVEYLGQLSAPFSSKDIRSNRFHLVLRSLKDEEIPPALAAIDAVRRDGVPNYFDDQRFGSVPRTKPSEATSDNGFQFPARLMVLGHYEEALKRALTAPYEFDRNVQKKEKKILREHWNQWPLCKEQLPRGHCRSLVDYLVHHPTDYRGALARMRPELRGLLLSAYQSHLWNRMLARWIKKTVPADQRVNVRLRLGDVPMHRELSDQQRHTFLELQLPLPTARIKMDEQDECMQLMAGVLAEEGLELNQLKLKGFRDLFFSKGDRAALCIPRELSAEVGADELNARKQKLRLSFELPRGSYATLIVKRIAIEQPSTG